MEGRKGRTEATSNCKRWEEGRERGYRDGDRSQLEREGEGETGDGDEK